MKILIYTTDGKVWESDYIGNSDMAKEAEEQGATLEDALDSLVDLGKNIKQLSHFSATVKGNVIHFHPANIVAISFQDLPRDYVRK